MGLVIFLYAFSSVRSSAKPPSDLVVNFKGDNNIYITAEAVNKLLIQNNQDVMSVPKDILDLNGLETALKSNAMIKTAEVYLTVNGEVRADIEQRRPIARVQNNEAYYIDADGKAMPLSSNYSARVPLVRGVVDKNDLINIYKVASKINQDEFLRTHVVEIYQGQNGNVTLKMRQLDFEVAIGRVEHLDKKINNLKAFYQKAKKDKSLDNYSRVNLQFENQVVCTKK